MSNEAAQIAAYVAAVESFNRGDVEPFGALISDDCTFLANDQSIGRGATEIRDALALGRRNGWTTHNLISIASHGQFIATVFRNEYSDGAPPNHGAGIARFNDAGKLCEMRAMGERVSAVLPSV
jgi:hypothetical protein